MRFLTGGISRWMVLVLGELLCIKEWLAWVIMSTYRCQVCFLIVIANYVFNIATFLKNEIAIGWKWYQKLECEGLNRWLRG